MSKVDTELVACQLLEAACWRLRYFARYRRPAEQEENRKQIVKRIAVLLDEMGLVREAIVVRKATGKFGIEETG